MTEPLRIISRLYWRIAFLILIIGTLVIALIAEWSSKEVAQCVNSALAARAPATGDETAAQKRFASELRQDAVSDGVLTPQEVQTATQHYIVALDAVMAERAKTPLGRC